MHPLEQIAADEILIEDLEDHIDRMTFQYVTLKSLATDLITEALGFTAMTAAQSDWKARATAFINSFSSPPEVSA